MLAVYFEHANTVSSPQLTVQLNDGTGTRLLGTVYCNASTPADDTEYYSWGDGSLVIFTLIANNKVLMSDWRDIDSMIDTWVGTNWGDIGDDYTPVYFNNNGYPEPIAETIGSESNPIYIDGGIITETIYDFEYFVTHDDAQGDTITPPVNNYLHLTGGDMSGALTWNSGSYGISADGSQYSGNAATATLATTATLANAATLDAGGNNIATSYVKKIGDTLTGTLSWVNPQNEIFNITWGNNQNVDIGWSYANNNGAGIGLRSVSRASQPGNFIIYAKDSTNESTFRGTPDGHLYWNGNLNLTIPSTYNNFQEGIRIHSNTLWEAIVLCGNDNTGDTGTSAKTWGIFNNDGTFYINQNGSNNAKNARAMATANGWTFGNTATNDNALNTTTLHTTGATTHDNTVYVNTSGTYKILCSHSSQTKGTTPTSTYYSGLFFLDSTKNYNSSGGRLAGIEQSLNTSNMNQFTFRVYQPAASSSNNAHLYVQYYNDGTTKAGTNSKFYGAVWNDYAEYREMQKPAEPGRVVKEIGNDSLKLVNERLQYGCEIVSDTFGFAIGETERCNTPIAVTGRVLAYPYETLEEFKKNIGRPVCSGPNGTVSIMTPEEERMYPGAILGTISAIPEYKTWGTNDEVNVNNRVWIRVR